MADLCFDVATGLSLGRRERQEDSVIADFSVGAPFGFAVLSDGMGGHACGDVASGIIVTEVFSELKMQRDPAEHVERRVGPLLRDAVAGANECIALFAEQNPESQGMGGTLVAPIVFGDRLYWISVGDSLLYLYRDGALTRLNADHSFAAEIDAQAALGRISLAEAEAHPDRECLLSVLAGSAIAKTDCRDAPFVLREGDLLLAASDGLLSLTEAEITTVLQRSRGRTSHQIGATLLQKVQSANCPEQDNLSLCVIKAMRERKMTLPAPAARATVAASDQVLQMQQPSAGKQLHTVVSLSREANS